MIFSELVSLSLSRTTNVASVACSDINLAKASDVLPCKAKAIKDTICMK